MIKFQWMEKSLLRLWLPNENEWSEPASAEVHPFRYEYVIGDTRLRLSLTIGTRLKL